MKVLYIADPGSVGGAARALVEITSLVRTIDVEPIVCTSIYDELNKEFTEIGIENFACGHQSAMNTKSPYKWKRPLKYLYESLRYYRSLPKAIEIIEKQVDLKRIDLIHTNSARNDVGCLLNKKYGIPHVMHIREFGQEDFNCCIYRANYYEYISKYSTSILAISMAVKESWQRKGVWESKLRVLYDGVDINKITVKTNYSKASEPLKMIIAGGVCEPKGQHRAIEAMGLLPEEIKKKVFLDIAGWWDDRYVDGLKQRIGQLGLKKQVNFLGTRKDLYEILKNYDIGLTCSKSEGFGRVTAEYMYTGLGTIGANTGATPELIHDGTTGLIFNYREGDHLAQCIKKLFYDRSLLKYFGINAHHKAIQFSAKRNAEEIVEVYKSILQRSVKIGDK